MRRQKLAPHPRSRIYNGASKVNGAFATTTGTGLVDGNDSFGSATSGYIIFVPTAEQQIAAGQNATYELRANVTGVSVGGHTSYLNVSLAYANAASTAPATGTFAAEALTTDAPLGDASTGFIWSDRSSINPVHSESASSDWTNDYLLTGLPLTLANQSGG